MKCPFRDEVIVIKTDKTKDSKVYYDDCYGADCQMYNQETGGCIRCEMMKSRKN